MIFEFREISLKPGAMQPYLRLAEQTALRLLASIGYMHGHWTSDIGRLNCIWTLSSFASLAEREHALVALSQNPKWNDYQAELQMMTKGQNVRLAVSQRDLNTPTFPSNVYELRIYRTQPSMALAWTQLLETYLPMRERYSPLIGLWTQEAPSPDFVLHLWSYPDLKTRSSIRSAVSAEADWQDFISRNNAMLVDTQSTILIPTALSRLK